MANQQDMRVERSQKRVRVMLGGEVVADSRSPLLVWEKPYYPTYYFPVGDVRTDLVVDTGDSASTPRGETRVYDVKAGGVEATRAAYRFPDPPLAELRDTYAFRWGDMDHWFEEDEEVYVHPRDPYKRVDILQSSRPVRVELGGSVIAESNSPTILFETGLPPRYYLPKTAFRMGLLEPTDRATECPYKGTAEYWTVVVDGERFENLIWSYPFPTLESARIAGLMSFYNEKVDLYVDGELQERPQTPFG